MSCTINPQPQPTPVMQAKSKPRVLATQHFMHEHNATAQNFEEARGAIYKMGIKSSYSKDRMIYSTLHTNKNTLDTPYTQECNGLILEIGTWRPLMMPPRSLRFNINSNASNRFLHQGLYRIYKAADGTCINLYFYNDKWCISTARGYEMNDLKWEDSTYQELVNECLAELGLTWRTFTDQLNKASCYSFGFKHERFHRFQPHNSMWFIQSVDLDDESDHYLWASDVSPIKNIKPQPAYTEEVGSLKTLYRLASGSLAAYIADKSSEPCFGFILRSVNSETTGSHSDLFIESSLMRQIRQLCYDNNMHKDCMSNDWVKEDAVTLNAYIDSNRYENFMHLFPQYQKLFDYYNTLIQRLVSIMVNPGTAMEPIDDYLGYISPTESLVAKTAKIMLDHFRTDMQYNLNGTTGERKTRVLTEFVVHPDSLDLLMHLLKRGVRPEPVAKVVTDSEATRVSN
jgi:hypothetical protein